MRTNKMYLASALIAALVFAATGSSVTTAEESGGIWSFFFGTSSKESKEKKVDATATHEQVEVVKVTVDGDGRTLPLHDFCLDPNGNILAGVGGNPGEIRILDSDGNYVNRWVMPVNVDAIGIGPDGHVYVGGGGKLLKLDGEGHVVLEAGAPHLSALEMDTEQLRKDVIEQHKQQAKMIEQQIKMYEGRVESFTEKIEKQEKALKALDTAAEERSDESEADSKRQPARTTIEQQLARDKTMLKAFRDGLDSMNEYAKQVEGQELTDEQIDNRVMAAIQRKQKISSISAAGGDVFVTCLATVGHGFVVWRTNEQFEDAKKIVEGLSGCCGQMDARGGADGLYVAENGRHRVCKYDRDGELIDQWGKGARNGLVGFGGCCNPKNVAFGPNGEVYTVEDTNGRVKRYSPGGELLGLVGTSQIGDGCLDISVAVSKDGERVYVLDTDADHIVLLKRKDSANESKTRVAGTDG